MREPDARLPGYAAKPRLQWGEALTLIIALRCADAVVMASDSLAIEQEGNVRRSVDKIFPLSLRSVWGASGGGQMIRELNTQFGSTAGAIDSAADPAELLANVVRPVLVKYYNLHLQVPGLRVTSPATNVLACGVNSVGEKWIVEIDQHCTMTHYEDLGFHAIGGSASFAQLASALLAHFDIRERPVHHGKLLAFRVMDAAIESSTFGVAKPIQMWVADDSGARRVSEEELDVVEARVGVWRDLERATLDELMGAAGTGDANDIEMHRRASPIPDPQQKKNAQTRQS